jgi:hypothetical protein
MRSRGNCVVCNEFREIVSRGRCTRCLGKAIRARGKQAEGESPFIGPDRSQQAYQKELNKARTNFSRMISLLDDTTMSDLVLPKEEYVLIKDCLLEAMDKINGMQKDADAVNDVNTGPELTASTSTTGEFALTPPTGLTASTDPPLLTPDGQYPEQDSPPSPAFKFKIHPMQKSGDGRHDAHEGE